MYDQQKLERKQLEQKKLQEQASQQQYQMMQSPFQNLNNVKPSTGLTPGTIYAQPDKHYNPHRGSNVNLNGEKKSKGKKESHVGIGSTPPKSILTPPKLNRPKSPGKKVHFVDQAWLFLINYSIKEIFYKIVMLLSLYIHLIIECSKNDRIMMKLMMNLTVSIRSVEIVKDFRNSIIKEYWLLKWGWHPSGLCRNIMDIIYEAFVCFLTRDATIDIW